MSCIQDCVIRDSLTRSLGQRRGCWNGTHLQDAVEDFTAPALRGAVQDVRARVALDAHMSARLQQFLYSLRTQTTPIDDLPITCLRLSNCSRTCPQQRAKTPCKISIFM